MTKIRVLLADDHAVLRAGLKLLINTQPDMEVVGEAGTFPQVLERVCETEPDVVTLDLTMPGGQGIEAIGRLSKQLRHTRILVVTMHDDPAYLRAALAAGAFGYVVKKAADSELLTAIRAVAQGRVFVVFDPGSGQHGLEKTRQHSDKGPLGNLSAREREVLQLLAEGHTNQAIADRLFLSVKSIESYRARLMSKLEMKSRAELVHLAVQEGLLSPKKLNLNGPNTTSNTK